MNHEFLEFLKENYRVSKNISRLYAGAGWRPLITLSARILSSKMKEGNEIVGIKEKFGGLRIYTKIRENELEHILVGAERGSLKICELCGRPGSLVLLKGWPKALCEKCAEDF